MKMTSKKTPLAAVFLAAASLAATGCTSGKLATPENFGTASAEGQTWSIARTPYGVDSIFTTECVTPPAPDSPSALDAPHSIGAINGKNVYYTYAKGQRIYMQECAPGR